MVEYNHCLTMTGELGHVCFEFKNHRVSDIGILELTVDIEHKKFIVIIESMIDNYVSIHINYMDILQSTDINDILDKVASYALYHNTEELIQIHDILISWIDIY